MEKLSSKIIKEFHAIVFQDWKAFLKFIITIIIVLSFEILNNIAKSLVEISTEMKEWRLCEANINNLSIGGVQNILEKGIEEKIPPK